MVLLCIGFLSNVEAKITDIKIYKYTNTLYILRRLTCNNKMAFVKPATPYRQLIRFD